MGFTIHFDRHSALETCEVEDVAVARILPPKAQTKGLLAQLLPKDDFWQGQVAAELPGTAYILTGCTDGAVSDPRSGPSTMLRMVPLPVPGRI